MHSRNTHGEGQSDTTQIYLLFIENIYSLSLFTDNVIVFHSVVQFLDSFFIYSVLRSQQIMSTLRLIYPQWQGGDVTSLLPELDPNDAMSGYYYGAKFLEYIAPATLQNTVEVPISLDKSTHSSSENGIKSYKAILQQTKDAMKILNENKPDRIVTLGGECSVSVVPFTYMADKYPEDVAIVWLDAHPDVNIPGDTYQGYHAMALTACLGLGDPDIIKSLPAKFPASKALLVGLREWDQGMQKRQQELGIKGLAPEETAQDSSLVLKWLKSTGVSKVVLHFDLDVLDPKELIAAVGVTPDGMKISEAVRVINDIAAKFDVVALTIAEHMPRVQIKLQNMMRKLPLLNE